MNATAGQNNNVVGLNVRSVYNSIVTFLDEELKSENTRRGYKADIIQFFKYMRNKELNELIEQDLMFEYEEVLKYRGHLKRQYNGKATTINRKITSLKKLYRYLTKVKYNVNMLAFDLDELPELNSVKRGFLSLDEAKQMVELAKELPDNGLEKSLVMEVLYKTSIRVSAVLNLEWSNFKKIDGNKWLIVTVDKGKMNKKPITDDLYQRLLSNKRDKVKVFQILDSKTIGAAMNELCRQMSIGEERNISPHSMKKVLINHELRETGNVLMASKQGNNGLDVMQKYYEEEFQDWNAMPAIVYETDLDLSKLEGVSTEELMNLIKKCSRRTQMELLSKLQG